MEFSRNTSTSNTKKSLKLLFKTMLIFVAIFLVVILLNKIDFPSPNKEIEKIISNDNLKIVK
tara:strand:+ start:37 stop:222 length:186 start_codon:yes stop_codon:yes gene_type:complete